MTVIRSEGMAGLATFTCQIDSAEVYASAGFSPDELVFVERSGGQNFNYIGFDYAGAGVSLAQEALAKGYQQVVLVTENPAYSCERQFLRSFCATLEDTFCCVRTVVTDSLHCNNTFLQLLNEGTVINAIFMTSYRLAQAYSNIQKTFFRGQECEVYTLSPLFTMPTRDFNKYELNYRLLGRLSAERLICQSREPQDAPQKAILENDGLRRWIIPIRPDSECKRITVLTLDSPTARIMESLSKHYTDVTGIEVKIAVSSYDGIHEILKSLSNMSVFDVIRIDHGWLSWFGEKVFLPLDNLDAGLKSTLEAFIPGLIPQYTNVGRSMYTLPETPNSQLLFYRRDLFENPAIQRLFKEQNKCELVLPETFEDFNRIARFFTKKFNPHSPVNYGTTLTLGNSGVVATEYLTRFFSHTSDLFSPENDILIESEAGLSAIRELVEARQYTPSKYNDWWRETASTFARGDTAMTIIFSNYASEMLSADSRIMNKIGYAVVPGRNPLTGGGSIGVCRNSRHPREALDFIQWICSEEVTTAMTLMGSVSPCRKTYENYEVLDTYPWLSLSKDCISLSHTNRIPSGFAAHFDERGFLSILGMAVNNAITGTMEPEEAITFAAEAYRHAFLQ